MDSLAFTHDICNCSFSPFLCSPGEASNDSGHRFSPFFFITAFIHMKWNPQYFPTTSPRSPRHFLNKYGVHSIDSQYMESTIFTLERQSAQRLLMTDGVHSKYSSYTEYRAFIPERWGMRHLLMRDGVHNIY